MVEQALQQISAVGAGIGAGGAAATSSGIVAAAGQSGANVSSDLVAAVTQLVPSIQVGTVPPGWTTGIFFSGANPVPGTVTGPYIDFTATGTNLWLNGPGGNFTVDASGNVIIKGTLLTQLGTSGTFVQVGGRFATLGDSFHGNISGTSAAGLHSVTVKANSLVTDGQSIIFEALVQIVTAGVGQSITWTATFAGTQLASFVWNGTGTVSHIIRVVLTKVGTKCYYQAYDDGAPLWTPPAAAASITVTWTVDNVFSTGWIETGTPNNSIEEFYLTGFGVQ